ncbi:MAG TPA: acetyl-CoA carboxylase, carboxyltransferase subunit beta [Verrucomicrobiae bacterium]|nr:acetyl-CoA carboxylase, carboxyltransferase subunit beta [Verrucomicrobiae bacterium]
MSTTSFTKKSLGLETVEPALTPPPIKVTQTNFAKKPKLGAGKSKKRDIPEGLWTKCPACETMIFDKELDENLKVCPKCQHHFPISARERIHSLVETCTFEEMDAEMASVDVLKFTAYESKLERDRKATLLKDAVVTGLCKIGEHRVALGVMEFGFLGGSMGSVVGEKLTRLIERGTEKELPVIIISASGGARMQEGAFSLMQMAKTSAALAYHAQRKLPYISILTQSDYGGVMASYASLGDLILAEPRALIGFAGPRVIKDTTQAELPEGFQTAEFLLDHGLIDAIVSRKEMKADLIEYLSFLTYGKKAESTA